jgi:hypothetical protein
VQQVDGRWIGGRQPGRGEAAQYEPGEKHYAHDGQGLAADSVAKGAARAWG